MDEKIAQNKKKSTVKKRNPILRVLMQGIGLLFPFLVIVVLLKYIIVIKLVPTASMEPNIMTNDLSITNVRAYDSREVERYDVVLAAGEGMLLQKRVIGMPGDEITFIDGIVYINGNPLEEWYLADGTITECHKTFNVPEGCYFLMGDNRTNSEDARMWENPYTEKKDIKGRTFVDIGVNSGFHMHFF